MSYEKYRKELLKTLQNDYCVKIETVSKTNRTLEVFAVCLPNNENTAICIYPELFYENQAPIEEVLSYVKENTSNGPIDLKNWIDFVKENWKELVFPSVINTELNSALLKESPHRKFCDLSIVYRIRKDNAILTITNEVLNYLNISEENLYEIALNNLKSEVWFGGPYICAIRCDDSYGAGSILDIDTLKQFANRWKSNLYIIPSSIEEIMIVPTYFDASELKQHIKEVNADKKLVNDSIFLSNNLYKFDKNTKTISIM